MHNFSELTDNKEGIADPYGMTNEEGYIMTVKTITNRLQRQLNTIVTWAKGSDFK